MKAAVIGKMREEETGSIFLRGRIWWVRYLVDGKPFSESSGSTKKDRAERLLRYRQKNGITVVDDPKKSSRNIGGRKKEDKFKPRVFSAYKFDPATGGKASVAAKLKKQDFVLRRRAQAFAVAANLTDGRYRPLVTTLARITILLEKSYQHMRDRESLLKEDGSGELMHSVDMIRKLSVAQVSILNVVGLTPSSKRTISNGTDNSELEQALARIDTMKRVREDLEVEGDNSESTEASASAE